MKLILSTSVIKYYFVWCLNESIINELQHCVIVIAVNRSQN